LLHTAKRRRAPSRDLASARRYRTRLCLEQLESRTVLSTYSPAQIATAYGFSGLTLSGGAKGDGSGQTIAIVDAYHAPNIKADLATFSSRYGLPALDGLTGHGTFTQLDLSNGRLSPPGDDWTFETALDVEWAHAVAPKANILLVEAASDAQDYYTGEPTNLLNAVQTAAGTTGVSVVSMSWGIGEVPGETAWDSVFSAAGVTFLAASGDSGAGTIWPAVSPNVVSVGGTTLRLTTSNTIYSETGWGNGNWSWYFGGSGGGFSQYESLPSYQQNAGISSTYTQFGVRLNPDVAYDANPNTGFAVVNGGRLYTVGGTSAGAPQWAGLVAIANQARQSVGLSPLSSSQTLSALYSNPSSFHDITSGSTGYYNVVDGSGNVVGRINVTAHTGYDLVTGLGSPAAGAVVSALAPGSVSTASRAAATSTSTSTLSGGSGSTGAQRLDVPASPAASGGRAVLSAATPSNLPSPQFTFPPVSVGAGVPAAAVAPSAQAYPRALIFAGGPEAAGESPDRVEPTGPPAESGQAVPPGPAGPAAPAPQGEVPGPVPMDPQGAVPPPGGEARDSGEDALPDGAAESEFRMGTSAAALGLAVALTFPWRVDLGQFDDRKRFRLREGKKD
jgi:hypothetical protein